MVAAHWTQVPKVCVRPSWSNSLNRLGKFVIAERAGGKSVIGPMSISLTGLMSRFLNMAQEKNAENLNESQAIAHMKRQIPLHNAYNMWSQGTTTLPFGSRSLTPVIIQKGGRIPK